jgi:hypothetical protein
MRPGEHGRPRRAFDSVRGGIGRPTVENQIKGFLAAAVVAGKPVPQKGAKRITGTNAGLTDAASTQIVRF